MPTTVPALTASDFDSDQEVRWCPGCGDFAVLAYLKQALAEVGVPREKIVFVSGIGCSSRLPYYLNTYGFHTISGRGTAVATGLKVARPDLSVWVVTGDGDAFGAGTSHLMHALRRNVGIKILLFNNEVLGLSKGQYSPTTRLGTISRTSRDGSVEPPLRPLAVALAAEASFVARTIDMNGDHLAATLKRAAAHPGSAFVEIYQNCKIFNDGVFDYATDLGIKADNVLYLEHGQPLLYGKDRHLGLRLNGLRLESVERNGVQSNILTHDESAVDPALATLLARAAVPELPECFGVLRSVVRPTYETHLARLADSGPRLSDGGLGDIFACEEMWEVEA